MTRLLAPAVAALLAALGLPCAAAAQVLKVGEQVDGSARICLYEVDGQPFSYSTSSTRTCREDVHAETAVLAKEKTIGAVSVCEYRAGGTLVSTRTAAAGGRCPLTIRIPDFAAPACCSRPLTGGATIRVRTAARTYQGTLLGIYADSIALVRTLAPDQHVDYRAPVVDTAVIPLATVRQLEQSAGRRGHAREGGYVAMAAVTVGTLFAMIDKPGAAWFNGSLLSIPACLTGVAIGAAIRTQEWQPVNLEALRGLPAAPAR